MDMVRIDSTILISELSNQGVLEGTPINKLLKLNKITHNVFNNSFFKSNLVSSPVFVSELTGHLMKDFGDDSFLSLFYHYSVPILIADISYLNHAFCTFNNSDYGFTVSEAADRNLINKILSRNEIRNYYIEQEEYHYGFCSQIHNSKFDILGVDWETDLFDIEKDKKIKYLLDEII